MKTRIHPRSGRTVQLVAIALAIAISGPAFAKVDRDEKREAREESRDEKREARTERREAKQERREDRREARHERREDRQDVRQDRRQVRQVRQERREDRQQALRYQQQYQQRVIEQQRRWLAYAGHDRYRSAPYSHRYRIGNRYWNTNQHGAELVRQAAHHGYAEGIRAGQADRYDRWRFDYRDSWAYREGSYGYNGRYISRDHYAHYFREGFRRGYEDGYYGRSQYGRHDNGQYFMIGTILSSILGLQSI